TPGAPSETDVPLSWNAAPVELNGIPRAVYFEVARTDDPANPFRQGMISLYRAKRELRLRLLDFANQAQADALVGLWAAPQAFPKLGAEQLRPVADLVLTREGSGGYTARSAHPYPTTRSGAIEATSSLRISADGLTADDRGFDADGKQVWGPHSEQGLLFRHVPAPATADTRDNGLVVIDLIKGNAEDGTLEAGGQVAMQFTAWTTEGLRLGTSRGAPARQ